MAEAKKHNPVPPPRSFDFICDTLLFRNVQRFTSEDTERLTDFVMKFQQLTGPVMAKGIEDTAFYIYNRLTSLNEVGGEPQRFGTTVAAFTARTRSAARLAGGDAVDIDPRYQAQRRCARADQRALGAARSNGARR